MSIGCDVVVGDCVEVMRGMAEGSVDSVVCDPPYGLEFMGEEWDRLDSRARIRTRVDGRTNPSNGKSVTTTPEAYVAGPRMQGWHEAWAREALRVLKPGGHLLAFGGTRTYHRLACAIEDAGFEIRDQIQWLYGQGFPKSLDVSKAIDKAVGVEREIVGERPDRWTGRGSVLNFATDRPQQTVAVTGGPATPEAERWQGWGTALKPACEPIVVARRPLVGTVAKNVLAHGTGAMNIDGCRIGPGHTNGDGRDGEPSAGRRYTDSGAVNIAATPGPRGGGAAGRWPANVILDEEAGEALDDQVGTLKSGTSDGFRGPHKAAVFGRYARNEIRPESVYGDEGGASRFFYCAKAAPRERHAGLGDAKNPHPTVKPVSLMRYLVRLVTPPGGLVLDPFLGSGTTGIAALQEGFRLIGVERDSDYAEVARQRIEHYYQENS